MPDPVADHYYDLPVLYDVALRGDTARETAFLAGVLDRHGDGPCDAGLEPACGTGRLLVALAARGHRMAGCDLSEPALRHLRRRLKRRGLTADLALADMADFDLPGPFDFAFCTFSTFRHLLTEEHAVAHLRCVARHLRPGGLYVLGLHLYRAEADYNQRDRWTIDYRRIHVEAEVTVDRLDVPGRREHLTTTLHVRRPSGRFDHRSRTELRLYTLEQFEHTLAAAGGFEPVGTYDFDYDLDRQVALFERDYFDVVFVLRHP